VSAVAAAIEVLRVLAVAARVEAGRVSEGPVPLLARLRLEGAGCRRRDQVARARFDRAVRLVDRCFPGGPNCYRRVLLAVALDGGAAAQGICLALKAGGGPGTGHAYFADDAEREAGTRGFDVVFEI
jgi:hypothetical protein